MVDALSIALSGLTAQQQRLSVAANNIANATTTGRVPTAANPASTVYRPLDVSLTALVTAQGGAGVQAHVTEDPNGFSVSSDPSSPFADEQGLIAVPNVDFATEFVNILQTKAAFKADVSVIKTQKELNDDLLNVIT